MKAKKNIPTFEQFWREVEAKAAGRGPAAVEHLQDLRAAFRLARELVRARHERGLTQQTVAKLAGIAQADLSRYEQAKGNPGFLTLEKLGKVYGGVTISFGPRSTNGRTKASVRKRALGRKGKSAAARRTA